MDLKTLGLLFVTLFSTCYVTYAKLVFCYYSSFSRSRPGQGRFQPEDVDPKLCTHMIYAFVDMQGDTGLRPNHWLDYDTKGTRQWYENPSIQLYALGGSNKTMTHFQKLRTPFLETAVEEYYQRTLELKRQNPDLKVLLAVGGWDVGSEPFVAMMSSPETRRAWAKNVVKFLRNYGFDGLDMDWEFPGTRGSPPADKYRFTDLLQVLQYEFTEEARRTGNDKLILTLATASGTYYIDQSYEPWEIPKYIDYMLLMTYNYHGNWENVTGHHSGLNAHWSDFVSKRPGQTELHQQWSIDYWLDKGMPKDRLIVGLPTYGMSFTLENPNNNGIRAPTVNSTDWRDRAGDEGPWTRERGVLSYYEICTFLKYQNWDRKWIREQEVPYATKGDQWVGYEDIPSITIKSQNIVDRDLGGAFVWSVEMDDFRGLCGEGKYPLLSKINEILKPEPEGRTTLRPPYRTPRPVRITPVPTTRAPRTTRPPTQRPITRSTPRRTTPRRTTPRRRTTSRPWWQTTPRRTTPRRTSSWWTSRPTTRSRPTRRPQTSRRPGRPTTQQPTAQGVDCSVLPSGIYADPSSCSQFIFCAEGRPFIMQCSAGTKFDVRRKVCDFENLATCP